MGGSWQTANTYGHGNFSFAVKVSNVSGMQLYFFPSPRREE
jgi:hypothetical protein